MSQEMRPDGQDTPAGDAAQAAPAADEADVVSPAEAEQAEAAGDAAQDGDAPERQPGEMTLVEHLRELRQRLSRVFIALIVGMCLCYNWAEDLFQVLMAPMEPLLHGSTFIYTHPTEAFVTYLKVAMVAGFFVVSPYIFYQLWLFVAPGLYAHERKWLIPIAMFTASFFAAGSLFGYFVVFPAAFNFLAGYSSETIVFTPKLDEYLSFVLRMLFAFGIIFELPLVIFFLARLGLVDAPMLRKFRRWSILISFIVAAVLTPTPDALTQCLMAGPLLILYELGILVAALFSTRKPKPPTDQDDEGDADDAGEDDVARTVGE